MYEQITSRSEHSPPVSYLACDNYVGCSAVGELLQWKYKLWWWCCCHRAAVNDDAAPTLAMPRPCSLN
eukprot:9889501-Ditylum_brightwellii.AAC.1